MNYLPGKHTEKHLRVILLLFTLCIIKRREKKINFPPNQVQPFEPSSSNLLNLFQDKGCLSPIIMVAGILFHSSIFLLISILPCQLAFTTPSNHVSGIKNGILLPTKSTNKLQLDVIKNNLLEDVSTSNASPTRRSFLTKTIVAPFLSTSGLVLATNNNANAIDGSSSTSNAEITSKIFIELKGLPPSDPDSTAFEKNIITIGLFGKDAPQPVSVLEQLVSSSGYPAKCKPREERLLQREQLEANKVYNSCMEMQDNKGVNYDLSTVWRIVKGERIDLGAVSGKFVAREYPAFEGSNSFKHDAEGVVSVRSGNDGGFGFTIYPGTVGGGIDLDETNIVVGRVIGGMDVLRRLNQVPVVQSSAVGYKALSGGDPSKRSAPSRACRYGSSELYCNEFKPLKKISIFRTGVVS